MAVENWLVPVVAIIMVCAIPLLETYMKTKKDMLLIEKGLYKPKTPKEILEEAATAILMAELILTGVGAAIFIGLCWEMGLRAWTIAGLIPCFIGIALLISYPFIKKKE